MITADCFAITRDDLGITTDCELAEYHEWTMNFQINNVAAQLSILEILDGLNSLVCARTNFSTFGRFLVVDH